MSINFSQPATTRNYSTEFTQDIQNNIIAISQWLDSTNTTIVGTVPTYAKRINRSTNLIEEYNGASWATYPLGYIAKTGDTMTGTLTVNVSSTSGLIISRASGNTSGIQIGQTSVVNWNIQNIATTGDLSFNVGASDLVKLSVNGNLTINAPSSGSHTFNGTINFGTRPVFNGNTPLDSSNYNSYAPTLTGTGASGSWNITSINVSGTGAMTSASLTTTGQIISGSGSVGTLKMDPGDATHTGYLEWYAANGNRQGYIGYSTTTGSTDTGTINLVLGTLSISGALTSNSPLKGNSGSKGWGAITTTTTTGTPTGGSSGDFYFVY